MVEIELIRAEPRIQNAPLECADHHSLTFDLRRLAVYRTILLVTPLQGLQEIPQGTTSMQPDMW